MSRAAGWAPAGAARGMATTFYCGSFVEGKPKKLPTKVGYLLSRPRGGLKTATRALVKELVQMDRTLAAGAKPPCRLWHL